MPTETTSSAADARTSGPLAGWLLLPAGLLASGVLGSVLGRVLPTTAQTTVPGIAAGIAAGVAVTVLLGLGALAAGRHDRLGPIRDPLLVLAVLSIFGWASAAITALPSVSGWIQGAPIPVAFLLVNAMKLTSVLPLLLVIRHRRWDADTLYLRVGDPAARTGIPHLSWGVLGPVVIVLVLVLFLIDLPIAAYAQLGAALLWLPVMLLGSGINAASEELLYRHALIGTARGAIGLLPAVLLSSVVFGLGHITGNPGGLTGVLYTTAYGLVCAAAMVRTRGLVWNWLIHLFGDLAIVFTLTLAALHAG